MSENNILLPPILPQVQNGILDKSKLHGKKIKVEVPTAPPLNLSDGDSITVKFTADDGESLGSTKQLQGPIDPFIEFDFSSDMPSKKYKVGYTVDDVIGNNPIDSPLVNITVIDGSSTPPSPADKEPFIVMGARYADLAVANELKAPQRLTAWTKDGEPYQVMWNYIGGTSPFTSPFSYNTSSFLYDTAPWLPIVVTDGIHTLKINPINVFGNGGTAELPPGAFNDPMVRPDKEQYPSAFAVLLNDNTMVGWGGEFGNSYIRSGIKTITTGGTTTYAGLTVDSTLWDSTGHPVPFGTFDDVGAGGHSFFAASKDRKKVTVWGKLNVTYDVPSLGNGDNVFVGNSFACTLYNTSGTLWTWWRIARQEWVLEPAFQPALRYLGSMPRGFITIDTSGRLSAWGDPKMFTDFDYSKNNGFIQATGIGMRQPKPSAPPMPLGNIGIRDDGTSYAWSGMMLASGPLDWPPQATDLSATGQKIFALLRNNKLADDGFGGLSNPEIFALTDIVQITTSINGIAVLRKNGTVVTWINNGMDNEYVIHPSISQPEMKNVRAIYGTGTAFLALTADNKVYTWGSSYGGGDSSGVQAHLEGKLTYYMD